MPLKNVGKKREWESGGIVVKIIGDFGPFSTTGKSIGYQITVGRSSYLIDCGAPLFKQVLSQGIETIRGIIITHCHDDHKRWFTDLALYKMYTPKLDTKVHLLTSEDIMAEVMKSSGPSLDRSLSADSKRIVDVPFDNYVTYTQLGPKALYRITALENNGATRLAVIDSSGSEVGPEKAKIVIHPKTKRPRMLFKDTEYGEWVEPESFYPYSSQVFYEGRTNSYRDEEGFTITAIKSAVWHGLSSIGLAICTGEETLVFSSDTAHDVLLWKKLAEEKRPQHLNMSRREFEMASVIMGDINNFIERAWSQERFRAARRVFRDAMVIHDIASKKSVVHTDYENLHRTCLRKDMTILTHSPDTISSEWVLTNVDKKFLVRGDKAYEIVGDDVFEMNADIYHREAERYFVGFKNARGKYIVYRKKGLLGISDNGVPSGAKELYRVDLYEDIGGRYYPKLSRKNMEYRYRSDGQIEVVSFSKIGSVGRIATHSKKRLPTSHNKKNAGVNAGDSCPSG